MVFRRRLWWSLGAVMPPEQNGQAPQRAGAEEGESEGAPIPTQPLLFPAPEMEFLVL